MICWNWTSDLDQRCVGLGLEVYSGLKMGNVSGLRVQIGLRFGSKFKEIKDVG